MQTWIIVNLLAEVRTADLAREMERVRRWELRPPRSESPARGRLAQAPRQAEAGA
jgi:hypothetical protein